MILCNENVMKVIPDNELYQISGGSWDIFSTYGAITLGVCALAIITAGVLGGPAAAGACAYQLRAPIIAGVICVGKAIY